MIIDCHTHIDRAGHKDWTPDQLLSSMDSANIDYSIVISNHITDSPLDKLLSVTKGYDRFFVMGNVEYENVGKGNLEKLIGHLEKKEIIGVKLFPGYENYFPYDSALDPLFSYMEKHNHPLMIHSGVLMVGMKGFLDQAHPLHVARIAAKFPELKIVIAHMGNPFLIDTVAVLWQHPHVYTDLSGFFVEFRSIDPREAANFLKRMDEIRDLLGSFKRCLFGTDWPLYSQKEYIETIQKIPLTDEEKELVFWKNAQTVFNLDLKEKKGDR